jgi:hypothetical protein
LLAALSGCGADGNPVAGRRYGTEWDVIDLDTGATLYIQPTPLRRVAAAGTKAFIIEYRPYKGMLPDRVRVRTNETGAASQATADLTLSISQAEGNASIDAAAFTVRVPPTALPLTLEELRGRGPLGIPD